LRRSRDPEGKIGGLPGAVHTNENLQYFEDAYEIGYEKVIDTYTAWPAAWIGVEPDAVLQGHRQTRDVNKAQIYAAQGNQTLYYIRLRQMALEGTEVEGCVSCML
jgi:hypothetical protein